MINIEKTTSRKVLDYKVSRYACYLIVQNGNPRKEVIALGQTYFAIQIRKQELMEKIMKYSIRMKKRLYQRNLTKKRNLSLQQIAKKAGVKKMDPFHNAGYKGLYNGESADDIFKRK
jgi:DNA-damage-inducible protein D